MAKTNMQDPLSGEARSAWLAGLTEACNKISGILNMKMATFTDLPLTEVFISATDRYRIYQAPLGNKLWLTTPAPVIKKNGMVITPENDHFEIDYLGGSINFDSLVNEDGVKDYYRLTGTDTLTVSATYIVEGSQAIEDIETELENVGLKANHFKGYFETYDALVNGIPTGQLGDYAIIGSENSFYVWNEATQNWIAVYQHLSNSVNNSIAGVSFALGSKQDKLIGTQGQVVGFDSSGNAVAQDAPGGAGLTQAQADGRYIRKNADNQLGAEGYWSVHVATGNFIEVSPDHALLGYNDGFEMSAGAAVSEEGLQLTGVVTPTDPNDGVNKQYVDDAIADAISGGTKPASTYMAYIEIDGGTPMDIQLPESLSGKTVRMEFIGDFSGAECVLFTLERVPWSNSEPPIGYLVSPVGSISTIWLRRYMDTIEWEPGQYLPDRFVGAYIRFTEVI